MIPRPRLDAILAGTILVAVLGVASVAAARDWRPASRASRGARPPDEVSDWRRYSSAGHREGPVNAPVVITVFSDFQCPFCRRSFGALRAVQRKHPADVALDFRHFPLMRRHKLAYAAALASECAAAQGRFDEYSHALFERQHALAQASWTDIARRSGVGDTASFSRCVSDSTYAPAVQADLEAGRRLGVRGTPTILVNSWRLHRAATLPLLDSLVARELGEGSVRR